MTTLLVLHWGEITQQINVVQPDGQAGTVLSSSGGLAVKQGASTGLRSGGRRVKGGSTSTLSGGGSTLG